jgi:hypothetical protein
MGLLKNAPTTTRLGEVGEHPLYPHSLLLLALIPDRQEEVPKDDDGEVLRGRRVFFPSAAASHIRGVSRSISKGPA